MPKVADRQQTERGTRRQTDDRGERRRGEAAAFIPQCGTSPRPRVEPRSFIERRFSGNINRFHMFDFVEGAISRVTDQSASLTPFGNVYGSLAPGMQYVNGDLSLVTDSDAMEKTKRAIVEA